MLTACVEQDDPLSVFRKPYLERGKDEVVTPKECQELQDYIQELLRTAPGFPAIGKYGERVIRPADHVHAHQLLLSFRIAQATFLKQKRQLFFSPLFEGIL